jgi:hypothetical protein
MLCSICQKEFIPNKYKPSQKVCSNPGCQRLRQIQNEKDWRARNPDYFKCLGQEKFWRENRHRYSKLWRVAHKDSLRDYEQSHKEQRRQYMREYMRARRKVALYVNREKS